MPLASCSTATRAGVPPPSVKTSRTRWPGALGATMRDIDAGGRGDGAEADVEAVGEHEGEVGLHVGRDLGVVDLGGGLVGGEVHDDVGPLADFGDGADDQAGGARAGGVGRIGAEADADIDARVLEVEGVGVALRAVADDGDFFAWMRERSASASW